MAKSKARKKREHLLRNSGRNVSILRAEQPEFSMHERKTKTKKEIQNKIMSKHKKRFLHDRVEEGTAFYIYEGWTSLSSTYD